MRLPQHLLDSVRAEVEKIDRPRLAQAAAQLTERYKAGNFSTPAVANDAQRAAYLAVRFPATYAVNRRVFAEIASRAPHAQTTRLLDLGPGPGTGLFAAADSVSNLKRTTLLEADEQWLALGRNLAKTSGLDSC